VLGIRPQDEYRLDLQAAGIVTRPVPTLRVEGAARSAQWARDQLADCAGYWVHVDVDVLDPAVMPAVDAPSPGGIAFPELELLLAGLVESPHCLGVEITVFDPDYDPDGGYAEEITSTIVAGLQSAHAVDARPDLVAARRDLLVPGRLAPAAATRLPVVDSPAEDSPAEGFLVEDSPADPILAVESPADGSPEPDSAADDLVVVEPDLVVAEPDLVVVEPPADRWPDAADLELAAADAGDDEAEVRGATRPLGSAPLLDSKPLPATMPGMLRPRVAEEFTLPAQRPAFEVGPEQPADLT